VSGSGDGGNRIVVGADGSDGSNDALRWADRQAGCTGAVVEAVIAWEWPAFFGVNTALPEGFDPPGTAEQVLDQAVREVLGENPPAGLQTRVTEGRAGQVLVEVSQDAELLVVGTRGHGGLVDALLGSVSTYCVHHAHCPVVVIRPDRHEVSEADDE
jgi:nucleotide-binding universal stress UspA family protein